MLPSPSPASDQRSCRNCSLFVRVKPVGPSFRHELRGFCLLGGNERDDFGRYISASESRECTQFTLSKRNMETSQLEHELSVRFWKSLPKQWFAEEMVAIKKGGAKQLFALRTERKKTFDSANLPLVTQINERWDLSFEDYMRLLKSISLFVSSFLKQHSSLNPAT